MTKVWTHKNDNGTEYRFPTQESAVKRYVNSGRIDYGFWHFIDPTGVELDQSDVQFLYDMFYNDNDHEKD